MGNGFARAAKATSGLLPRLGCVTRLLALVAVAAAVWLCHRWFWATMASAGVFEERCQDLLGILTVVLFVLWHIVSVVVAGFAVGAASGEGGAPGLGRLPFVVWSLVSRGERVTVWMALLWILLWPGELAACLAVASWRFGDATLWRR